MLFTLEEDIEKEVREGELPQQQCNKHKWSRQTGISRHNAINFYLRKAFDLASFIEIKKKNPF